MENAGSGTTLLDADPANNPGNWQWVAGCGLDAAPYFRIFNPLTQAQKFDPDGAYVRRWAPGPRNNIVDLKASRERALAAFKEAVVEQANTRSKRSLQARLSTPSPNPEMPCRFGLYGLEPREPLP